MGCDSIELNLVVVIVGLANNVGFVDLGNLAGTLLGTGLGWGYLNFEALEGVFRSDMTKPCVEACTLTKNEKPKVSRRKCLEAT